MSNEVCEEACGFREVLGGLVGNDECEIKLVFILDGFYENNALLILRSIKRSENSE